MSLEGEVGDVARKYKGTNSLNIPLKLIPKESILVYIFFDLKMAFKNPEIKPTIVKVPPIKAQIEVKNSYHCLPFFTTLTDIGERS